jgi:hypothetical protein
MHTVYLLFILITLTTNNFLYAMKTIIRKNEMSELHLCKYCNKIFNYSYFLKQHMQIHTGKKPYERSYQCEMCNAQFNSSVSLANHKRSHIKKAYQCTLCNASYTSLKAFCSHKKSPAHLGALAAYNNIIGNQPPPIVSTYYTIPNSQPSYESSYTSSSSDENSEESIIHSQLRQPIININNSNIQLLDYAPLEPLFDPSILYFNS